MNLFILSTYQILLLLFFKKKKKHLLSWGSQTPFTSQQKFILLWVSLVILFFFFFFVAVPLWIEGSQFPHQESNPCSLRGSTQSLPLDSQQIPCVHKFWHWRQTTKAWKSFLPLHLPLHLTPTFRPFPLRLLSFRLFEVSVTPPLQLLWLSPHKCIVYIDKRVAFSCPASSIPSAQMTSTIIEHQNEVQVPW